MKKRVLLLLILCTSLVPFGVQCARLGSQNEKKELKKTADFEEVNRWVDCFTFFSEKYPVGEYSEKGKLLEAIFNKYFNEDEKPFCKREFLERFYEKGDKEVFCNGCDACTKKGRKCRCPKKNEINRMWFHIENNVLGIRLKCNYCGSTRKAEDHLKKHINTLMCKKSRGGTILRLKKKEKKIKRVAQERSKNNAEPNMVFVDEGTIQFPENEEMAQNQYTLMTDIYGNQIPCLLVDGIAYILVSDENGNSAYMPFSEYNEILINFENSKNDSFDLLEDESDRDSSSPSCSDDEIDEQGQEQNQFSPVMENEEVFKDDYWLDDDGDDSDVDLLDVDLLDFDI